MSTEPVEFPALAREELRLVAVSALAYGDELAAFFLESSRADDSNE
jgi:hypothetical protein